MHHPPATLGLTSVTNNKWKHRRSRMRLSSTLGPAPLQLLLFPQPCACLGREFSITLPQRLFIANFAMNAKQKKRPRCYLDFGATLFVLDER